MKYLAVGLKQKSSSNKIFNLNKKELEKQNINFEEINTTLEFHKMYALFLEIIEVNGILKLLDQIVKTLFALSDV